LERLPIAVNQNEKTLLYTYARNENIVKESVNGGYRVKTLIIYKP